MSSQFDIARLAKWVRDLQTAHYPQAVPVQMFGFPRLSQVWEQATLARTRVVIVANGASLPVPPAELLPGMPVADFADMDGITFGDLYFVRDSQKGREPLHFHEIVHVVQWHLLGVDRFLEVYLSELLRAGYRQNRLEQMAYDLEAQFASGRLSHKVETHIKNELRWAS
jgi:hypothetical protein